VLEHQSQGSERFGGAMRAAGCTANRPRPPIRDIPRSTDELMRGAIGLMASAARLKYPARAARARREPNLAGAENFGGHAAVKHVLHQDFRKPRQPEASVCRGSVSSHRQGSSIMLRLGGSARNSPASPAIAFPRNFDKVLHSAWGLGH